MFRTTLTIALLLAISPSGFAVTEVVRSTPVPPPEPWESHIAEIASKLYRWPLADSFLVPRVAKAVAKNAYRAGVEPDLILAVMRVENPWLKPDTVSYAGAVGLLQVMPRYWGDEFPHCGDDLTDIDTNICKGVLILLHYLETNSDLERALLAYNGCRSAYCEVYYDHVTRQLD
jgi:soluble lytic murein transglycosylase-like protein